MPNTDRLDGFLSRMTVAQRLRHYDMVRAAGLSADIALNSLSLDTERLVFRSRSAVRTEQPSIASQSGLD